MNIAAKLDEILFDVDVLKLMLSVFSTNIIQGRILC